MVTEVETPEELRKRIRRELGLDPEPTPQQPAESAEAIQERLRRELGLGPAPKPAPAPAAAPTQPSASDRIVSTFASGVPAGAPPPGAEQVLPRLLQALEMFQRNVMEPAGGLAALGARKQFLPQETELERKTKAFREQGMGPLAAVTEAYRGTDLPSVDVPISPVPIPLPGGRSLQKVAVGEKGAWENVILDPLNLVPGLGLLPAGGAGQAARRGAAAAKAIPAQLPATTRPVDVLTARRLGQPAPAVPGPRLPVVRGAQPSPPTRLATLEQAVPPVFEGRGARVEPTPVERMLERQPLAQPSTPTAPSTPAGLMAPTDAEQTLKWFGSLIASPESARAMELTLELRRHALGRRFQNYQTRAKQLVDEGVPAEEAMRRAQSELKGQLPSLQTGLESTVTEEVRNALFSRVYRATANSATDRLAALEALTNALLGKPVPRKLGVAGGSALRVLSAIFPPEIMQVLNSPQTLDQLLLSKMPRPRGIGTPVGFPEAGALDAPSQARMFDAPFVSRQLPPDPRTAVQRQLDLEAYKVLFADAPTPSTPHPFPVEPLDEVVQGALRLINPSVKEQLIAAGKFAGMQASDAGLLLRSNVASFDLSYPRQMALLIPRHPVPFGQSFYDALRTVWSREFGEAVMGAIEKEPLYALYAKLQAKEGRDFLRPLSSKVAGQWQAQEDFMILSRVTGETRPRPFQWIAEHTPWIRISARAHIIGINSMTWRIFKGYERQLLKKSERIASGAIKLKPGKAFSVEQELDTAAQFLAEMSGRGPLGPLKALSPALNAGFFSLRLNIGRLIAPRHLFSSSPFVRRKAWESFIAAITTFGGFVMAGRAMGLWDVETDRRSADFMKILLNDGRTRIDVWGGMQQFAVLYGRLLSVFSEGESQVKSTTTGQVKGVDPIDLGVRAVRSKLSPAAHVVVEAWTQKDFKGSKIDRADWQRWLRQSAPIAGQDIYEAFEAHGLIGVPIGGLGAFGIGEQVYDLPRWPELDEYYTFSQGRTLKQANALRARFRGNPDNEAKLFLRGQITTLSTPAAKQRALALMRELKVNPADVPGYEKVFGGRAPQGVR